MARAKWNITIEEVLPDGSIGTRISSKGCELGAYIDVDHCSENDPDSEDAFWGTFVRLKAKGTK